VAKKDPWPIIHAERQALAADLESLTDKEWETPSLCEGWSVRQVLGHMTQVTENTAGKFFPRLIASGFSLNAYSEKEVAKQMQGSPADTLRRFKASATSKKHPPGPIDTWLGEAIVHCEDIRRPLKIKHDYPVDALIRLADSYRRSNLVIGGKRRVAGLTLRATDADWSAGSGPEASGPMLALMLMTAGRPSALDELSGPGVATLRSRM
jgi:uncharacterized protein (TIGR03083 family)